MEVPTTVRRKPTAYFHLPAFHVLIRDIRFTNDYEQNENSHPNSRKIHALLTILKSILSWINSHDTFAVFVEIS